MEIITHPEPLKAAYRALLQTSPQLLQQHHPDIVVHVGLAVERDYFAVEQGVCRDGYHQYPDVDLQVLAKAEDPRLWGKKSAARLDTSLDLAQAVERRRRRWRAREEGQGAEAVR
jgi:pyroglutamyl-peptidase